jgi:Cdc6-like AAA superfamily ATPase
MLADPRVFREDHLPNELPHRDAELQQVFRQFEPAVRGVGAHSLLLSGPSGVGKTVLSRHAVRDLRRERPIEHALVPCLGKTTGDVLRAVLRQHTAIRESDIPGNQSVAELRIQLRETLDGPMIVVLDEGDDLADTDVLDEIMSIANLGVVAIAHDATEWLGRLDAELANCFSGDNHIALSRYGVDELADILERRARSGLAGDYVTRRQLEWIADEAAGVARRGIQALRATAEIAGERRHETIQQADLEDGFPRARRRIRAANLKSLPYHHQVLYALIHAAGGEITVVDLNDRYEALSSAAYADVPQTPITRRSRRNKLQKLIVVDQVVVDELLPDRVVWAVDRDVEPRTDIAQVVA